MRSGRSLARSRGIAAEAAPTLFGLATGAEPSLPRRGKPAGWPLG